MREIKFRAWDKLNEKMLYNAEHTHHRYRINMPSFGEILDCPNSYDVMQYTSLKDRDGKDIYEGDIVEFSNGNLGKVIWYHLRAGFDVAFANAIPEELDHNLASSCEVVDNIYENKGLSK